MTDNYDKEFIGVCEFLSERLGWESEITQKRVAACGLRLVRFLLNDIGVHSNADGIEWTTCLPLELDPEDMWLIRRLEVVGKMIEDIENEISRRVRH